MPVECKKLPMAIVPDEQSCVVQVGTAILMLMSCLSCAFVS